MKTFIKVTTIIMMALSGVFVFLAMNEEYKGKIMKKEKELRAKQRQKEFDAMMKLVNSKH